MVLKRCTAHVDDKGVNMKLKPLGEFCTRFSCVQCGWSHQTRLHQNGATWLLSFQSEKVRLVSLISFLQHQEQSESKGFLKQ